MLAPDLCCDAQEAKAWLRVVVAGDEGDLVDLKQIDSQVFLLQNGLIQNNKELQFETCGLMVNLVEAQRNKEEESLLWIRKSFYKERVHWRRVQKFKVQ